MRIKIQAAIKCRSNVDPNPKHYSLSLILPFHSSRGGEGDVVFDKLIQPADPVQERELVKRDHSLRSCEKLIP
jgi:hypothetical protein